MSVDELCQMLLEISAFKVSWKAGKWNNWPHFESMTDARWTRNRRTHGLSVMIRENKCVVRCGSGVRHTCWPIHRFPNHLLPSSVFNDDKTASGSTTGGDNLWQQHPVISSCMYQPSDDAALPSRNTKPETIGWRWEATETSAGAEHLVVESNRYRLLRLRQSRCVGFLIWKATVDVTSSNRLKPVPYQNQTVRDHKPWVQFHWFILWFGYRFNQDWTELRQHYFKIEILIYNTQMNSTLRQFMSTGVHWISTGFPLEFH